MIFHANDMWLRYVPSDITCLWYNMPMLHAFDITCLQYLIHCLWYYMPVILHANIHFCGGSRQYYAAAAFIQVTRLHSSSRFHCLSVNFYPTEYMLIVLRWHLCINIHLPGSVCFLRSWCESELPRNKNCLKVKTLKCSTLNG